MEIQGKTPVDVIQEMIAIHLTRKESAEKLSTLLDGKAESVIAQSDSFNAALLSELSSFGDGTSGVSDRENNYQSIWKSAFQNLDNLSSADASDLFEKMEVALLQVYGLVLETKETLPESLVTVLTSQREQLAS